MATSNSNVRYFENNYPDYHEDPDYVYDIKRVKSLIIRYIGEILKHTRIDMLEERRSDLYVGDAGKHCGFYY